MELSRLTFFLLLFCLKFFVNFASQLSYENIKQLNANCSVLDTCSKELMRSRNLDNIKERNCACDSDCAIFGDCCIDAKFVSLMPTLRQQWECKEMRQFGGIYMKSSCPHYFKNYILKTKCESEKFPSDPMSNLPVTNMLNKITYKNIYCAMCNEDLQNITFWNPRLECDVAVETFNKTYGNLTNEYIQNHIVYFDENSRWGINLDYPYMCDIDPVFPEILQHSLRSCKSGFIDSCPSQWKDEEVINACNAYQAVVYAIGNTKYWNPHCALCNGIRSTNTSRLICKPIEGRDKESGLDSRSNFNPTAFAMLFDVNTATSGNDVVGQQLMCHGDHQVFDPFLKICRNIVCGFDNYSLVNGKCIKDRPVLSDSANETYEVATRKHLINDSSLETFLSCPKIVLNEDEFYLLKNNSIYMKKYERLVDQWTYDDDNHSVLVCSQFTSTKNKFSVDLGILSMVGLGISIFCLLLHLLAFSCVPEVRNLSGLNLMSLSLTLIIAYGCFILSQWQVIQSDKVYCKTLAIVMYFFFLLSFQWMNVMAFDVWRTLRQATNELRVTSGKQKIRFAFYTLYTTIITAAIVTCAAASDHFENLVPVDFQPGFGLRDRCWFSRRKSLVVFFVIPAGVIMTLNLMFFVLTSRILTKSKAVTTTKFQTSHQTNRRDFKLYLRLSSLMGLSWIAGFLATVADNLYIWYAFVLLNTLQGVFIFASFSCNKKIRNSIRSRFVRSPVTSNLVSSHSKPYSSQSTLSSHLASQSTSQDGNKPWTRREFPTTLRL